jgi:hypothetical protein
MLLPMQGKTFFFIEAGGGVHGMVTGIVQDTITPAGLPLIMLLLSIPRYRQPGDTITEDITGKVIPGIISMFLISKLKETGAIGKKIDIGKDIITGVFRI